MTAQVEAIAERERQADGVIARFGFFRSLAGRLLALTMAFVLLAEVLIFIPSLAGFYLTWLRDRVDTAQIAALAVEATPSGLHQALENELLANAEVERVTLLRNEQRLLELSRTGAVTARDPRMVDLRTITMGAAISGALGALFGSDTRDVQVTATPRLGSGERIQIVVKDAPLKRDLRRYATQVFLVSLALSLLTASFVYAVLVLVFVRPMRGLTTRIERFRANPEAPSPRSVLNDAGSEIGRAESALEAMEAQVRASLRQRERLAALGGAVARIAHDLRSGLATAQLLTERLAASADPSVRQIAPRLERAIERAGGLAQAALRYGKTEETAPRLEALVLSQALQDAAEDALAPFPHVQWRPPPATGAAVWADPDQVHRIFVNLLRNGAQALTAQVGRDAPGIIAATITVLGHVTIVRVVDDGPGIPQKARERLFEPFSSAQRTDGTGLGLAIARELARAQGGDVELVMTGPEGTAFEVRLPSVAPTEGAASATSALDPAGPPRF